MILCAIFPLKGQTEKYDHMLAVAFLAADLNLPMTLIKSIIFAYEFILCSINTLG